jgi:hypothetical protein
VPKCYKQEKLAVCQSENCYGSVVVSCFCEKLVVDAGDSSGTQRKENVRCWKPVPSNGSEDVTVATSVCVCETVNCEVQLRAVSKSPVNPAINRNPVYKHTAYM